MTSYLKIAVIICSLFLPATFYFYRFFETRAQNKPQDPYLSANQQQAEFPSNLNLECSGCHGAGKTLPNLGGELFHKDAHSALDASIHAKTGVNGKPAPSCKNCHTINGDMTTVLPAENPKSTVNRANMVQTCGGFHEEAA
jgi:cytochrome c553